jgi:hypothetical protein
MLEPRPSAALYDLLEEIGASGGLDATLGALDERLRRLLRFDVMSVYLPEGGRLARAYSSGGAAGPPLVAAQVAETRRPAFNCDPGPGSSGAVRFRSSLAIPLDSGTEMVGVLALYSAESGVFEPADLGALLWIRTELARAVKHAQEAGGRGAGESYLRANLARLEAEVARSRADGDSLGLLVCALQDADIRSRYGDHAWSKLAQSVGAGLRRYSTLLMRAGNEYMLALPGCAASELAEKSSSVTAMAESIAAAHLGDRIAPLRAGSALFPEEAAGAEELLAAARAKLC